jgi:hypothetical protein
MARRHPPVVAPGVIVSLDRAAILAATPHFFVKGKPSPFDVALEDLPGEVRSAVGELRWSDPNSDNLRLLAYGRYAGAFNEQELEGRITGSDADLIADVIRICSSVSPISEAEVAAAIQSVFWDRATPWEPARSPAEGWAITVFELIQAVRPNTLPLLLRDDVSSRVVLPWLLTHRSPSTQVTEFVSVLMQSSNQQHWEAAAAFLTDATRGHILRNEPVSFVPKSGNPDAVLIVSGLLLTETYNFGRSQRRPLDPEAMSRWERFVETLRETVATATVTATHARKLLQSQDKDDTTLIALILGKATNATYRTLGEAGDAVIKQYFRPLIKSDEQTKQEKLPYLAPLIINDLVNIWIQIGADEGFFGGLVDGLRCDEYAFEFTYSHYLTDRSRATILAAIGAVAGVEMKNEPLRLAALALADRLRTLPEGVVVQFDDACRADLGKRTGIELPAK